MARRGTGHRWGKEHGRVDASFVEEEAEQEAVSVETKEMSG
jgi:hypothetical protein